MSEINFSFFKGKNVWFNGQVRKIIRVTKNSVIMKTYIQERRLYYGDVEYSQRLLLINPSKIDDDIEILEEKIKKRSINIDDFKIIDININVVNVEHINDSIIDECFAKKL